MVVWGKTSTEVNLPSRILLRINLAEPKEKSKKMSPTDLVEQEGKAEAEVEAELRSKKEENLGRLLMFHMQLRKRTKLSM
jgi:hypothetical protein